MRLDNPVEVIGNCYYMQYRTVRNRKEKQHHLSSKQTNAGDLMGWAYGGGDQARVTEGCQRRQASSWGWVGGGFLLLGLLGLWKLNHSSSYQLAIEAGSQGGSGPQNRTPRRNVRKGKAGFAFAVDLSWFKWLKIVCLCFVSPNNFLNVQKEREYLLVLMFQVSLWNLQT